MKGGERSEAMKVDYPQPYVFDLLLLHCRLDKLMGQLRV